MKNTILILLAAIFMAILPLTQPLSAQSTIQIDATALSASQLTLNGAATFPTNTVQSFNLLPGNYQLQYGTGFGGLGLANFTVTASGTVDYASSLDLILSGRGTNSLVVLGATIQFDVRALSVASLSLGGIANFPTQATFSVTLLPGVHPLFYTTGFGGIPMVNFTVTASRTVDYDPSLDLVLSGRGTNGLVVLGATIQFDARALSVASLSLGGIANFPTQATFSATLLPGVHPLFYSTGFGGLPMANFTVTASRTVDYDPSLDLILSGRGTNSLVVLGATIQFDARALSVASLSLGGIANFSTQATFSATLLPGVHPLFYSTGFGGLPMANFTVTASGTVDYDPSLNLILSGRGTNSLVVLGATIQFDARALSVASLSLGGIANFPTQATFSATLLPGVHPLFYTTGFGGIPTANFTVTASRTVDYDPSLDLILSGRGTNSLVVLGATLQFDARALSVASLSLGGIANFPTPAIFSATLLPGVHPLFYTTGFGGIPMVNFTVTASRTVDYDPALDLILNGRGTSTLLMVGAPIRIDATTLDELSFNVSGIGAFSTCMEHIVTLLPGPHVFQTIDLRVVFSVTNGAIVDYDPAFDSFVSGRGTSTLTVSDGTGRQRLTADAGADKGINLGQSVTLGGNPTASGGFPPYTFSWTPTTGLDNANVANPAATPTSTTEYTVEVTDTKGCKVTDIVTVTVNPLPIDTIDDLIAMVNSLNLRNSGLATSLTQKLNNAKASLQQGDYQTALDLLNDFINQVDAQRGKAITEEDADALIAQAEAIIDTINAASAPKITSESQEIASLPTSYALEQNFPNPFNPVTTIQFSVPRESYVRLKVYNSFGAEVLTLVDQHVAAGIYKVNWDASRLASGFYLYRLEAEGFAQTKKLLLMK